MDNPFEILMRRLDNIEQLILNQNQSPAAPDTSSMSMAMSEPSMSIDETAAYLKCATSTVKKYRRDGVFPSYKAGRTIYFKKSEIDAALTTSQKSPGRSTNKNLKNRA